MDCEGNRDGQHCERCKPDHFFSPVPDEQGRTPCEACNCDPTGKVIVSSGSPPSNPHLLLQDPKVHNAHRTACVSASPESPVKSATSVLPTIGTLTTLVATVATACQKEA